MNSNDENKVIQFEEMGLDNRLIKSIKLLGWKEPTLIQEKVIPLALEGKDILAKGRTGCGKSAAFLIPIINNLLNLKKYESLQAIRAIILAPTRELCHQLCKHAKDLNKCSSNMIRIVDLNQGNDEKCLRSILIEKPDIVIGTPLRLLKHLEAKNINYIKETLKYFIVDEADLMFSFGYEKDMKNVLSLVIPSVGCQCFLVSATLNEEALAIKKLILHNPVNIKLEEPDLLESDKLTQYHVKCDEEEKFLLVYALFKLNLIHGKTLIFVNMVNRCYQLKLFLEQFGISSCILNSELPIVSRCFVVEQFNKGLYNIIIANDELCVENPKVTAKGKSRKRKDKDKDNVSNVSRGIDFQFVSNVINFDFPLTVSSYIHRVGRTARGCQDTEGTALSFVSPKELNRFNLMKEQLDVGSNFKPYSFRMEELEPFRYRSKDALSVITSRAIKEARIKEIKREIFSSEKLKSYLSQHPKDLKVLTQDKSLYTVKHREHLKHLPDYVIPPTLRGLVKTTKISYRGGNEEMNLELKQEGHQVKRKKTSKSKSQKNQAKNPLDIF